MDPDRGGGNGVGRFSGGFRLHLWCMDGGVHGAPVSCSICMSSTNSSCFVGAYGHAVLHCAVCSQHSTAQIELNYALPRSPVQVLWRQ